MSTRAKIFFIKLAVVFACVGVNYFGSLLAQKITIPIYLNSICTIFVTAFAGLWSGISNAILGSIISLCIFASQTAPSVDIIVQGVYAVAHGDDCVEVVEFCFIMLAVRGSYREILGN